MRLEFEVFGSDQAQVRDRQLAAGTSQMTDEDHGGDASWTNTNLAETVCAP